MLDAVDDGHLDAAQADPELLVRMAVQRHLRARLELDHVDHRAVAEQRAAADAGRELERLDRVEADELRLRHLLRVDDRHEAALAARPELGLAVPDGEDRVVAADLCAGARAEARPALAHDDLPRLHLLDRKSTRLNSSHQIISYAVFCLK